MNYILTVQCPDRSGLIHMITSVILDQNANIVLTRAVRLVLEKRVMVWNNKTIVFE
jgi:formyltetrahydrofolate hydrolase